MTADIRVQSVAVTDDDLSVVLMDGRRISVPLAWYPRLANATAEERARWVIAGGGYGIHWPDIDEDLITGRLLRGAGAPQDSANWVTSAAGWGYGSGTLTGRATRGDLSRRAGEVDWSSVACGSAGGAS